MLIVVYRKMKWSEGHRKLSVGSKEKSPLWTQMLAQRTIHHKDTSQGLRLVVILEGLVTANEPVGINNYESKTEREVLSCHPPLLIM